jgi:predicted Fe-Mo cluster-binding NifX family protein
MRIAISSSENKGLDSAIGAHFGRCAYFVLVDVEEGEVQAVQTIDNPYYRQHQPGQVPGFIRTQDADVMLSGGMGGRAVTFFQQYGIQPVTGAAGTVRQSVERYLSGELTGTAPCAESVEHGHGDPHRGNHAH